MELTGSYFRDAKSFDDPFDGVVGIEPFSMDLPLPDQSAMGVAQRYVERELASYESSYEFQHELKVRPGGKGPIGSAH